MNKDNRDKNIKVSSTINPHDNGGESVNIETTILWNGDNIYYNTEISLQSYCNYASIGLVGAPLTPKILRDIANQIESAATKFEAECKQGELSIAVVEVNKKLDDKIKKSGVKSSVKKYIKS